MKNLILTLFIFILQTVSSQTFMTIHKNDGTTVVIQLSQIDSITYSGNPLQNNILSNPGSPVVFDGYSYPTIVLGNGQQWMAENLKTSRYANGDSIPYVQDSSIWNNTQIGSQTQYNNNPQLESTWGKLYNFYAVVDNRNVCPTGWHVPTVADFDLLTNYLGGEVIAGGSLKETSYWQLPNQGASNIIGFSALPAGYRYSTGFSLMSQHGGFWTSSEDGTNAWSKDVHYDSESITLGYCQKTAGLSIRCIKD
jgi:uncharacterized protein (TIGR02145 family)